MSYLAHPRRKRPDGTPDPVDAAVAADNVNIATPFVQKEPLIVGHWDNGKLTLWEAIFEPYSLPELLTRPRKCWFGRLTKGNGLASSLSP